MLKLKTRSSSHKKVKIKEGTLFWISIIDIFCPSQSSPSLFLNFECSVRFSKLNVPIVKMNWENFTKQLQENWIGFGT
jgi:hypothetical protein